MFDLKRASNFYKVLKNSLQGIYLEGIYHGIVNPSYNKLFRTHTLYRGGGGYLEPPTISSTLSCTNVKFCEVLEGYPSRSQKIKG